MMRTTKKFWSCVMVFLLSQLGGSPALAQTGALRGEWRSYGGDDGSTKYAALDHIDANNIDQLAVAWQWESPDGAIAGNNRNLTPSAFKATPLMIDGVLYIRSSLSVVAAIDAETGEQVLVDSGARGVREFFAVEQRAAAGRRSALFRKTGVDEIAIDASRPYVEPLSQFFRARARRH